MRIGTWNVEYGVGVRNPDRLAQLSMAHPADIWVLTETHRDIDLSTSHIDVCSNPRPNRRDGSTWVTIWSRFPLIRRLSVLDPRRMVAALFDTPRGPLAVAGVVLPWQTDKGDQQPDPPPGSWCEHRRVLHDELPVLLGTLRAESGGNRRVIAGDFNSQLALPYPYQYPIPPNEELRRDLAKLIKEESFICHTADVMKPPPSLPQTLIDHICTDLGPAEAVETWSGEDGNTPRMSDHPGVVVTLAVS